MAIKASKLQIKTRDMVNGIGGYIINVVFASNRGVLDMFACVSGQTYAFEIKTRTDRLSALQKDEIEEFENAGGIVHIVEESTDFRKLEQEILSNN